MLAEVALDTLASGRWFSTLVRLEGAWQLLHYSPPLVPLKKWKD